MATAGVVKKRGRRKGKLAFFFFFSPGDLSSFRSLSLSSIYIFLPVVCVFKEREKQGASLPDGTFKLTSVTNLRKNCDIYVVF